MTKLLTGDEATNAFKLVFARREANRHLALYLRTGNGLLIWKAYREYRQHGLPVPENILAKLDQFADRLLRARGQKQIALALELTSSGGGSKGLALLVGQERARDIVEHLHLARQINQERDKPVLEKVPELETAQRFRISQGNVAKRYSEWMKGKTARKQTPKKRSRLR